MVANERLLLHEILGRRVVTQSGQKLGSIHEVEAERVGNELCITELLVGPEVWKVRLGLGGRAAVTRVPWKDVVALESPVRVRDRAGG